VRNRPRLTPGRWRAVFYAVLVHAVVILVIVIGFRWTHTPPATGPGKPIDATIAEDPQIKKKEENRRRAEEQKRREQEAEKKRQEEARKREEAEKQRLEAESKKAEAEKQQQVEAEKKRQADLKRQQEEATRRKQEAERKRAEEQKRRDEEARQKAATEKKRQEELRQKAEAERQRKAAEEQLKQQLAAEEEARAEEARRGRAATEMEKYLAAIRQHVTRRWNQPTNAPAGLKCVVRVRFVPGTWEIVEAVIVRGSGNKTFDDSVERAVLASSPLPLPSNPDLLKYFGELQFEFEPKAK
jgi:colicin import membrane protein